MSKLTRDSPLARELRELKQKTSWSWERMCREFHRVMGAEGPSHTTLYRYATGKTQRRNALTERYVQKALQKITVELVKKKLSESDQRDEKETHKLFQAIVEGSADVIYVQDLEGKYVFINPSGATVLGMSIEDIVGKSDDDLFSPKEAESLRLENHQVLTSGAPLIHETRVSLQDGERVFQTNKSAYQDLEGRIVGVIGICRDITELKEAVKAESQRS